MLSSDKEHLKLFENQIRVNENLPKWNKLKKVKIDYDNLTVEEQVGLPDDDRWVQGINYIDFNKLANLTIPELNIAIKRNRLQQHIVDELGRIDRMNSSLNSLNFSGQLESSINNNVIKSKPNNFISKIRNYFRRKTDAKLKKAQQVDTNSVEEITIDVIKFFELVKLTTNNSKQSYINRITGYLDALNKAQIMNQTALVEKLLTQLIINKYESVLYAEGYYNVISERQIVDFIKVAEKGVRLDYINNFSRPIPDAVAEKFEIINALDIFDNYVVMHYDPNMKSFKLTQEELAKKRDPILFGVIKGSNKLYYIADWIDEYCDLTLQEFIDVTNLKESDIRLPETINNI